jgi:hypothetical protein
MESTKKTKTILLGLLAMTALYCLPEPAIAVAKRTLEVIVVMQLGLEVLKSLKSHKG